MKRFKLLFLMTIVTTFCAFAQEEVTSIEEDGDKTVVTKTNSTDKTIIGEVIREDRSRDFNHWWMALSGGFNMMITERDPVEGNAAPNYVNNFHGAGFFNVGYMIDPIWGVLVEYGYIAINKKIVTPEGNFQGTGHEVTAQLDFNILNIAKKCRTNTKWNFDVYAGVGVMFYDSRYNLNKETGEKEHYFFPAIVIPVSLKVQYCPIDQLGIGLRVTGKWTSEDDINYRYGSIVNNNNDMCLYGAFELQYNITTPGKRHVRVTDRCSYEKMNVVLEDKILDINKNKEKIQKVEETLDDVQNDISILNDATEGKPLGNREQRLRQLVGDTIANSIINNYYYTNYAQCDSCKKVDDDLRNEIRGLKGELDDMKRTLANYKPAATGEEDPDAAAARKRTTAPAPAYNDDEIDSLKRDVNSIKREMDNFRQQVMMTNGTEKNTVYFDFNSSVVKSEYELVIARVARNMLIDKTLTVQLISNCDKAGTSEYNDDLGKNRALAVYFILVNRYKIEKSRISFKYDGQIMDQFDPVNRRCDILYK